MNPAAELGVCPDCGKVRYLTRAIAKRGVRRQSFRHRVYRCGDFWHSANWQDAGKVARFRATGQS